MLCDECKTNQAVYYKLVEINGQRAEKRLCAACQKKFSDFSMLKFSGMDLFGTLAGNAAAADRKKQIICGECGTTYTEFSKTGYLGCAHCYTEFKDALAPVIYKMQGGAVHTGKRPRPTAEDLKRQKVLKLKKELDKAVAEERFAEAQKLSDEIKKLTGNREQGTGNG